MTHDSTRVRCAAVGAPVEATVDVPGSKSITNRALMLAALAEGTTHLSGALSSDDTRYMARALTQFGFDVRWDVPSATIEVKGGAGQAGRGRAEVFIGNAGTAARFLTAAAALWSGEFHIDGIARMRERPIAPLVEALRSLGGVVQGARAPGCIPLSIRGGSLRGGEVSIPGDVSSQYITALLMIAPYLPRGLDLTVTGAQVSRPYIEMTIAMMRAFGVDVRPEGTDRLSVRGGQRYTGCGYAIEPDASGASYFFAAAAVTGGRVRVRGLSRGAIQGDLRLVEILAAMGCEVRYGDDWTEVRGPEPGLALRGVDVDMRDCSDVAQTLAVVASFASSPTRIRGVGFIRHKETDRIAAVVAELNRLGGTAEADADGLLVRPAPLTRGRGPVATYGDHRMAMSFAVAGLRVDGLEIDDPACVDKTFPDFFDRWRGAFGDGVVVGGAREPGTGLAP